MSNFKRWTAMKHNSRTKFYQLERHSTIHAMEKFMCIMLDSDCSCNFLVECKFKEEVKRRENAVGRS